MNDVDECIRHKINWPQLPAQVKQVGILLRFSDTIDIDSFNIITVMWIGDPFILNYIICYIFVYK